MDNRLIINQPIRRPQQPDKQQNKKVPDSGKQRDSFKNIFGQQLKKDSELKFSKHAQTRLISRQINVSQQELNQLSAGVDRAAAKGAKETLIMVNKVAYVVSVENKTVITAVDDGNMKEKVFTNIDSAVFMD